MNIDKRRQKELADAEYGRRLREQVAAKEKLEASSTYPGDALMNSTGGTVSEGGREGGRAGKGGGEGVMH